jgi:hypothetical protein
MSNDASACALESGSVPATAAVVVLDSVFHSAVSATDWEDLVREAAADVLGGNEPRTIPRRTASPSLVRHVVTDWLRRSGNEGMLAVEDTPEGCRIVRADDWPGIKPPALLSGF